MSPKTEVLNQEKFTDLWWNEFVNNTDGFSTHQVIKEVFDDREVKHLISLVESIVKKVTKDKKKQNYLRVWREGEYDNENTKFFKNNPIRPEESIETWKNRIFGKKKFGLFLNYANSHSDELSQLLISHIQPFTKAYGLPLGGISTTIILGDYGWTPLGIHRDKSGEYIIHYHLGPGSKDIYIWEKEKSDLYGFKYGAKIENTKEFMSDYSYKSSFSSGDIFSMTGKKVHIGNSQEFSISLVLEFNSLTQKELLEKMWVKLGDELFNKNFNGDKAKILPAYNKENHINYINHLTKGVKHYNVDVNQPVKKALEDIFLDHKYKLFSNAGFSLPPYVNEKKIGSGLKQLILSVST